MCVCAYIYIFTYIYIYVCVCVYVICSAQHMATNHKPQISQSSLRYLYQSALPPQIHLPEGKKSVMYGSYCTANKTLQFCCIYCDLPQQMQKDGFEGP